MVDKTVGVNGYLAAVEIDRQIQSIYKKLHEGTLEHQMELMKFVRTIGTTCDLIQKEAENRTQAILLELRKHE